MNRRKNVFTLGNFQIPPSFLQPAKEKLKKRQNSDLFERDPFKIQSYNFRYADRPIFTIPSMQQQVSNQNSARDCQTCFYNYDFPQHSNNKKSAINNDFRTLNLRKFQEYRRKKFLQNPTVSRETSIVSNGCRTNKSFDSNNMNLCYGEQGVQKNSSFRTTSSKQNYAKSAKSNYSQLPTNYTKSNYYPTNSSHNFNIRKNISHSYLINNHQSEFNECRGSVSQVMTNQAQHNTRQSQASSLSENRKRSLSAGFEININIKSLDGESISDNVNIKIETDSICNNLETSDEKNTSASPHRIKSSETFVIEKSSKFFMDRKEAEREETDIKRKRLREQQREREKERVKALTSVYSPRLLKTGPKQTFKHVIKSIDRTSSMVPFRSNSDVGNN